jgi:hypothetical protein
LSIKQTEHYTSASHSASCRHHRALAQGISPRDCRVRARLQRAPFQSQPVAQHSRRGI